MKATKQKTPELTGKPKPQLLPTIRRFGVFWGFLSWFECRQYGHEWEPLHLYPADHTANTEEGWHAEGKMKVTCKVCGCVALKDVTVEGGSEGLSVTLQ